MLRLALIFGLLASPLQAADPISAEEFDALTRGRTLVYSFDGQFHGIERHLGDRRVEWAFAEGECYTGRWYDQGDQICFVYENLSGPQCWLIARVPGGFQATFVDEAGGGSTYSAELGNVEMTCAGPMVGV